MAEKLKAEIVSLNDSLLMSKQQQIKHLSDTNELKTGFEAERSSLIAKISEH